MGLPLRNPNSFSLTSGAEPRGGSSDFGPDSVKVDSALEPSCYGIDSRPRRTQQQRPRRAHGVSIHRHDIDVAHSSAGRTAKYPRHNHLRKAHHLRVAPRRYRYPCAFDTAEARELARSSARLPGETEQHRQCHTHGNDGSSDPGRRRRSLSPSPSTSRSRSGSASPSSRRRPPSLERQDAFRDEKTVKRRQLSSSSSWTGSPDMDYHGEEDDASYLVRMERDEEADARYLAEMERREEEEVAELYRIGLLYDDEYERGEGFSLGAIVREEPVYSVRERRLAGRRGHRRNGEDLVALSLDLAFSAVGEDDALAAWLLSSSRSGYGTEAMDGVAQAGLPSQENLRDGTELTVIYELADDAVSAVSAYDFLDSVSVSEMSYCQPDVDVDDLAWVVREGCNEEEEATGATAATEKDVDPWIVLGHSGS